MKLKSIAGLILIIYCLIMAGCAGTGESRRSERTGTSTYKTESDGFRGIKWGQNINELKKMRFVSRNSKVFSTYSRTGDPLYLGKAKLNYVRYLFWHNKFYEARMSASPDQLHMLKKVLDEKYGDSYSPHGPHSKVHDYSWTSAGTSIQLSRTNFLADCTVTITSREISNQMK